MSRLNELFINSMSEEFSKINFEDLYATVTESKSFDRSGLRRLCIIGIYLADEKKMGQVIQVLGHYETLLREEEYHPILEEIQRIIVTLNRINKPETNINRLYV